MQHFDSTTRLPVSIFHVVVTIYTSIITEERKKEEIPHHSVNEKEIPTTSKRGIVEGFVFPAESGPLSLRFDPCRNWKSDLPPRQSRETTHRQPRERRRARERAGKRIVRFIQTKT